MKTFQLTLPYFPVLWILLFSCNSKPIETKEKADTQNLIVLVKYKTQPSKVQDALVSLNKLINEVKKEPNFVQITLYVDPADESNIMLYEEWSNPGYYNGDHMKTAHLQKFMTESREFLVGPPEISQWKIKEQF